MSNGQDRRAPREGRVSIETLVEICGNQPGIPAFEAEAVDVSARGMHLRTAYLPAEGAPLVCRFENAGQEIVVEGVVAWRKEGPRGGEFGVRFTALDSRSVDVLRRLVADSVKSESAVEGAEPGARVRLHIEGLGSPMKARVRAANGPRKIEVGSNLEFLRVGRKLELEDLEGGMRRSALIDGVDVVIDPTTRVPQLVVALRYEGAEDDTPQPSVTDLGGAPSPMPERVRIDGAKVTTSEGERQSAAAASDDEGVDAADPEADDELDEALRGKLGTLAGGAGKVAAQAGSALQRASTQAVRGVGQLFRGASDRIAALRSKNANQPKRRTTAAPPGGPVSIAGKRLRPQQSSDPGLRRAPSGRLSTQSAKKKLAVGAGASVVLVSVLAVALKSTSAPPPGAAASAEGAVEVQVNGSSPSPALPVPGAPARLSAGSKGSAGPVVANVPLFGPTPMATTEPAPFGPPSDALSEEEAELAEAKASAAPVMDEEFVDAPEPKSSAKKSSTSSSSSAPSDKEEKAGIAKRPEDVPAWGRGKMRLPTIHRLRLDAPGTEIRGEADAKGFTVLIPNRKVMEKAAPIAQRDSRIARVRANNTPGGAQIRMEFKDAAPGYRVRLRRDFVELLLSAPADKK